MNAFYLLAAVALGAAPPQKPLHFEEVVYLPGKGPNRARVFVYLTIPRADLDRLAATVVLYADAAVREAKRHNLPEVDLRNGRRIGSVAVVFCIRDAPGDRAIAYTGFSYVQLREYGRLKPEEARKRVRHHSWGLGTLDGR